MFESWPEMWGGGYPAYRTTLRKFLWFRTVTGGNAPEFKTVTGRIVSFLTKRIAPLKIEADLEPIQDLNGQDAPYPPGGGANIYDGEYESGYYNISDGSKGAGTAWGRSKNPIPCQPSTQYRFIFNKQASQGSLGYVLGYDSSDNYLSFYRQLSSETYSDGQVITTPENCAYIKFYNNFRWFEETEFCIELATATGFHPYSNECPISGHEGAVVTRTGKNLFGGLTFAERIQEVNSNAVIDTDAKTVSFEASDMSNKVIFDQFKPNTQYTFIISSSSAKSNLKIVYTDGTSDLVNASGTTVTNSLKNVAQLAGQWQAGTTVDNYEECGVFEGVLTADQFEAYSGTSVTLTFGQTVYGCKLTVNEDGTGSAVVEQVSITFDGSDDESWEQGSSVNTFFMTYGSILNAIDRVTMQNYGSRWKCNLFKPYAYAAAVNLPYYAADCFPGAHGPTLGFKHGTINTLADWKTFIASNPIQVTCLLATPVTIALTPGQVNALLGNNTVWVDSSDNISVTYQSN